ncbi:helix-turn-helix domain-containing protein [Sulfuritalea hydrogenivorans]|uniref:Helix-turn-helix domain-containing protein n=1 Tax=Sulfuritalea hydrogenivorans sk43H TaxID=1223802 RepID=W0SEM3_9PROT|nr:helix-turn-helix domain-containing protein [Sulfuritalea hydrogenivorans]BAO29377.1 hypothetical protein SUTH_01584 [Sulfuritalea hydrogenivorans sk43H]
MSISVMTQVWNRYPGGGTELLALLALADWSDDEGRCYPSVASIAKKTRLSVSQARRVVHRLIEEAFVSVVGNENGGAPGATRQYRVNLERLTTCMDATPTASANARGTASTDARDDSHGCAQTASANARGTASTDARDDSHGCAQTASTDASQTVSEPSVNHQGAAQALPPSARKTKPKKEEVTFGTWYETIHHAGEKPISDYQPLLNYVELSGLPNAFVDLAWLEFKRRYLPGGTNEAKRYLDWRRVFLKAVEGGWLRLWGHNGTEYFLTAQGQQAQRVHGFREAA